MTYGKDRTLVQVDIAINTALSGEVNVGPGRIVGIIMPAGWDAAGISFQALLREPSALPKVPVWGDVIDSGGAEVKITAPAADKYVALADTLPLVGFGRMKVRSGLTGAAVNQTAARTLFLVVEK